MKKFLFLMLVFILIVQGTVSYAGLGLYISFDDTYLDPNEVIVRDIQMNNFAFRSPEGWERKEKDGTVYYRNEQKDFTLSWLESETSWQQFEADASTKAGRTKLYQDLMSEQEHRYGFKVGRSAEAGEGFYYEMTIDSTNLIVYTLALETGHIAELFLASDNPVQVSDLSYIAKTLTAR